MQLPTAAPRGGAVGSALMFEVFLSRPFATVNCSANRCVCFVYRVHHSLYYRLCRHPSLQLFPDTTACSSTWAF